MADYFKSFSFPLDGIRSTLKSGIRTPEREIIKLLTRNQKIDSTLKQEIINRIKHSIHNGIYYASKFFLYLYIDAPIAYDGLKFENFVVPGDENVIGLEMQKQFISSFSTFSANPEMKYSIFHRWRAKFNTQNALFGFLIEALMRNDLMKYQFNMHHADQDEARSIQKRQLAGTDTKKAIDQYFRESEEKVREYSIKKYGKYFPDKYRNEFTKKYNVFDIDGTYIVLGKLTENKLADIRTELLCNYSEFLSKQGLRFPEELWKAEVNDILLLVENALKYDELCIVYEA